MNERERLLQELTTLDFMAVDLALFLDTHPMDMEAIAEYNRVIKDADEVRMKYEEIAGPLCSYRSMNPNDEYWAWKDNPWPWGKDFNFMYEEVCK